MVKSLSQGSFGVTGYSGHARKYRTGGIGIHTQSLLEQQRTASKLDPYASIVDTRPVHTNHSKF